MGYSSWSSNSYRSISSTHVNKSTDEVFVQQKLKTISEEMSPAGVAFRECRDSEAHPQAFGVNVFLDVTGSMGRIPDILVREKLGTLMNTFVDHGLNDVQVLFGAIGDHLSDRYPLQVGQFESGAEELNKWLTTVYLEGGGGGQHFESYLLAWYFAARHTVLDSLEKRGHKGILFTIGDEATWTGIKAKYLRKIFEKDSSTDPFVVNVDSSSLPLQDMTANDILNEAKQKYHVFHIHVNEATYRDDLKVLNPWRELLGERLLICQDHTKIAEIIASTVAVMHGLDVENIISGFDDSTAAGVKTVLANVIKNRDPSEVF